MKKKTYKEWPKHRVALHPAAVAAESDLVKLVRELESLRKQQSELDQRVSDSSLRLQQASVEYNNATAREHEIIEACSRSARVVRAQMTNAEELLRKQTGPGEPSWSEPCKSGGCIG